MLSFCARPDMNGSKIMENLGIHRKDTSIGSQDITKIVQKGSYQDVIKKAEVSSGGSVHLDLHKGFGY